MKFFLGLVLALLACHNVHGMLTNYCMNEDDVKDCIWFALDGNEDGNITFAEMDAGLNTTATWSDSSAGFVNMITNRTAVMDRCDVDDDGVLSQADWDDVAGRNTAGCRITPMMMQWMCYVCHMGNWTSPSWEAYEAETTTPAA